MGTWDLSHWWFLVKWDKGIRIKNTHPIVNTWWHSGPFWKTVVERGFSLSFLTMAFIFSDMAHLFELGNTCFYCYFSFLLIVFSLYHHLLYCSWPLVPYFSSGSSSENNPEQREHSIIWSFSTGQKPILNTLCNLTTFPDSHWFICWVQLTLPPKSLPKLPHPSSHLLPGLFLIVS